MIKKFISKIYSGKNQIEMNKIQLIKHPDFSEVRTIENKGEILFCAADVCAVLEMNQSVESSLRKLDDDEKLMRKVYASGQNRDMWFVTESGLYTLVIRSSKPEAKKFRRWITHDVLPSIRRFGYYIHPSCMTKKDYRKLGEKMLEDMKQYIYKEDLQKTAKKIGVSEDYVRYVLDGRLEKNSIMQELQRRALLNRENEINAYHPDRIAEVIKKLSK
jgi:prophage antirepressor-like protein